jgi:hypothetical protein
VDRTSSEARSLTCARVKRSETVSTAQLVLWADAIRRCEAGDILADGDPRADANEKLRDKSGLLFNDRLSNPNHNGSG